MMLPTLQKLRIQEAGSIPKIATFPPFLLVKSQVSSHSFSDRHLKRSEAQTTPFSGPIHWPLDPFGWVVWCCILTRNHPGLTAYQCLRFQTTIGDQNVHNSPEQSNA